MVTSQGILYFSLNESIKIIKRTEEFGKEIINIKRKPERKSTLKNYSTSRNEWKGSWIEKCTHSRMCQQKISIYMSLSMTHKIRIESNLIKINI